MKRLLKKFRLWRIKSYYCIRPYTSIYNRNPIFVVYEQIIDPFSIEVDYYWNWKDSFETLEAAQTYLETVIDQDYKNKYGE